jgi:hypothetical protein
MIESRQTRKLLLSVSQLLSEALTLLQKVEEVCSEDPLANYQEGDLIPDGVARCILGRTRQTFWRWDNDPSSGFPKPVIVNGRKFRNCGELRNFQERLKGN